MAQVTQTAVVEGKLREEAGRREESHQERLRAEKAAEDERSRHATTRRNHESTTIGSSLAIRHVAIRIQCGIGRIEDSPGGNHGHIPSMISCRNRSARASTIRSK